MLINCAAYENGKRLGDITPEQISDYVLRPECFVWVAIKDPEPDELHRMQEEFGLHPLAVEDALTGHQRPKVEEYGDSIFGRWWPLRASSTASGCRPNSSDITSNSSAVASTRATQTKHSRFFTYSLISDTGISSSFLPS
jgi:hypothetical protein